MYSVSVDHDPVLICPYDRNHKIARSRIQRHLVKCEKNFPPDYKQQCPFDATHRVFEHELAEHVKSCPMKFSCTTDPDQTLGKIPEIDYQVESQFEDDESWDDILQPSSINLFNESTFETINSKQYTTVTAFRGNALIAKRYNAKLRRPFGYSESMMLDTSSQCLDDDTMSISSDMGIGRGSIPRANRGQFNRGVGAYRRGLRGRH